MNLSQWFQDQLQSSADGFVWAVQQVPKTRRNLQPPEGLGEWSILRHIFHMMFYEKTYALPSMQLWLDEPSASIEEKDENAAWGDGKYDINNLLAEFKKVRTDQIALLPKFDESTWNIPQKTIWGKVTPSWVVSKTFQHTAEHTSDVMRIALFWDMFVTHNKVKSAG